MFNSKKKKPSFTRSKRKSHAERMFFFSGYPCLHILKERLNIVPSLTTHSNKPFHS